eukprot:763407-Pyramimonas_sp.AAC.1
MDDMNLEEVKAFMADCGVEVPKEEPEIRILAKRLAKTFHYFAPRAKKKAFSVPMTGPPSPHAARSLWAPWSAGIRGLGVA